LKLARQTTTMRQLMVSLKAPEAAAASVGDVGDAGVVGGVPGAGVGACVEEAIASSMVVCSVDAKVSKDAESTVP